MSIFKTLMQIYKIKRNGKIIDEKCYGSFSKDGRSMSFEYESDIQKGDIVIDVHDSFVITSIKTFKNEGFPKDMWHYEADIIPEDEYNKRQLAANTLQLHGCTINGAVQNSGEVNVNIGCSLADIKNMIEEKGQEDKERLNQLIDELQKADNFEIYKKGMLSNFADLLAKHEWLSGTIANYMIPVLFNMFK